MKDQLNTAGQSWSRFVSPHWARKLSRDKTHLYCLVRADMLEANYHLSVYKLKLLLTAVSKPGGDAFFLIVYYSHALNRG